jgi:type I restriction enzyme M protein
MTAHFDGWRTKSAAALKGLEAGFQPKEMITALAEDLLNHYTRKPLIDRYDIYQHLMDYWRKTMQDDCYLITADGWKAETYRIIEMDKKGKEKDKGWTCDLIPKPLIVARYYAKEQAHIDALTADLEAMTARLEELEEEQGGEEGVFFEFDKVNKPTVTLRLKEARAAYITHADASAEIDVLDKWLELTEQEANLKRRLKECEADLDAKAYAHYPQLSEAEIKALVVDDKWLAALEATIHGETDRVSQSLTQRVKELAERYETPLPQMNERVTELEGKVNRHLERMGFTWE